MDPATRRQLERGQRTVEVLKQGQYVPQPVEEQVMIIYVATNGYLDEVPVDRAGRWEEEFRRLQVQPPSRRRRRLDLLDRQ